MVEPPPVVRHRHVDVSSIVEVDAVSRETADRVGTLLTTVRAYANDQPLRVQTVYDEERARMKVIVLGGLADTRQLLEYLEAVLDS